MHPTPFTTGPEAWLKGIVDARDDDRPLQTRLYRRLGYKTQRHDFAKIADAAGYRRFIVMGESQTTVAGLWAAVEAAAAAKDASSPYSRIAGFIFTLVPTWGHGRMERFDEMVRVAEGVYGSFEAASANNTKDCSPGFGCISFAKLVAAKRSNSPSLEKIRACKGKLPPVMVLANAAAAPAHPVEHGRVVADALGAEFHVVETFEEAARKFPEYVADFVASVAAGEGALNASVTDSEKERERKQDASEAKPASPAAAGGVNVFGDVADGLTLTPEELLSSSKMCTGDVDMFPEITEGCKEYQYQHSSDGDANHSGGIGRVDADEDGWDQSWLDNPDDPAIRLYQQTGLRVGECVRAGYIHATPV